MFFFVSFADINSVINRSFCRIIRSKGTKVPFFAELSFSEKEVDVIIGEIFLGTSK